MEEQSSMPVLITELKRYLALQGKQLKFLILEKASYLLATVVFMLVAMILGIFAICYFSLSLVHLLQIYVGMSAAFAIVGGLIVVFIAVLYLMRKPWLLNRAVNIVSRAIFEENSDDSKEVADEE